MTLIVLDEAELEFLEAVNYYEEAAGLGAQFRDEVSAGVAWILENPRVLRLQGQCLAMGMWFNEREKNLFAGHLFRDFLSSRA
jgi:hypothetical protein